MPRRVLPGAAGLIAVSLAGCGAPNPVGPPDIEAPLQYVLLKPSTDTALARGTTVRLELSVIPRQAGRLMLLIQDQAGVLILDPPPSADLPAGKARTVAASFVVPADASLVHLRATFLPSDLGNPDVAEATYSVR